MQIYIVTFFFELRGGNKVVRFFFREFYVSVVRLEKGCYSAFSVSYFRGIVFERRFGKFGGKFCKRRESAVSRKRKDKFSVFGSYFSRIFFSSGSKSEGNPEKIVFSVFVFFLKTAEEKVDLAFLLMVHKNLPYKQTVERNMRSTALLVVIHRRVELRTP